MGLEVSVGLEDTPMTAKGYPSLRILNKIVLLFYALRTRKTTLLHGQFEGFGWVLVSSRPPTITVVILCSEVFDEGPVYTLCSQEHKLVASLMIESRWLHEDDARVRNHEYDAGLPFEQLRITVHEVLTERKSTVLLCGLVCCINDEVVTVKVGMAQ
jgi:hypothetical protein